MCAAHCVRSTGTGFCNLDVSVERPPEHRVKLLLVNAVLPGGVVVVGVYLSTTIGYSEQNVA